MSVRRSAPPPRYVGRRARPAPAAVSRGFAKWAREHGAPAAAPGARSSLAGEAAELAKANQEVREGKVPGTGKTAGQIEKGGAEGEVLPGESFNPAAPPIEQSIGEVERKGGKVVEAVEEATSWTDELGKLLSPKGLLRIGKVVLGAAILLVGTYLLIRALAGSEAAAAGGGLKNAAAAVVGKAGAPGKVASKTVRRRAARGAARNTASESTAQRTRDAHAGEGSRRVRGAAAQARARSLASRGELG